LAESPTQEAILERVVDGSRFVAVLELDRGHAEAIRLAEALPPPGAGWFSPSRTFGDAADSIEDAAVRAARAFELEDGAACVDLLATRDGVQVLELTAWPPRAELAALLDAASERPAAVCLLTGPPGQLPEGRVRRVG